MTALWVLTGLVAGVGLIWASRHIKIALEKRHGFLLTPDYPGPPNPPPKVSLLVAAKDEEANLDACLESLLAQDYPDLEIIAVNDRSEDRTGEILDRHAAGSDRLRAVHVTDLPGGWKGKNHAMHVGMQHATGELLLFTDADARMLSSRAVSVAVQLLHDLGAGFLCLLPNLEMKGFWEGMIQPVASGVMMIWFEPARVNNPRRRTAYANGAFMLMRREVYRALGGHEAVKDDIQEDMEFARLAKQQGLGLTVARCRDLFTVRMYTTLGQMFRGWTRIFLGCFRSKTRLAVSLLLVLLMAVLPTGALLAGLIGGLAGLEPAEAFWALGLAGLIVVAMQSTVVVRFWRMVGANPRLFWSYTPGSILIAGCLLAALLKHLPGAKLTWKGTTYTR
jgi:cellulose synthase/poly-beta-1,6-N-acetylglucosamine synthase-like glycosyltransferase